MMMMWEVTASVTLLVSYSLDSDSAGTCTQTAELFRNGMAPHTANIGMHASTREGFQCAMSRPDSWVRYIDMLGVQLLSHLVFYALF